MRIHKIGLVLTVAAALAVQAASTQLPEIKAQSLLATEDAVREGTRNGQVGDGEDRPTRRSGAEDRESVAITVYNQNFGLVREVRDVSLTHGLLNLEFGDVASSIQTETVHLRSLTGGQPLKVLEQNYQYDLLNPQKLLEKYVGRTVTVYRWNPESERDEPVQAEVISVNGGPILRIGDEITFNYPGRFAFPELPENLMAKPTLVWLLDSGRDRQRLEVSYLTHSLNWKADYVMVIDENDELGDLTGWVTLTNQSGAKQSLTGLVDRLTHGGVLRDQEKRFDEIIRDNVVYGVLPEGTTLETLREKGSIRYVGWGMVGHGQSQVIDNESDVGPHETGLPLDRRLERNRTGSIIPSVQQYREHNRFNFL